MQDLHERNQMLQDEFQFNINSLDKPRRINLTLFLGILGVSLAKFALTVILHNLSFNKFSMALITQTLVALIAACFAMKWVEKKIWMQENIAAVSLSSKRVNQEYLILVLCLITFGVSLVLVFNLGLVQDYLTDYLTALNMDSLKWGEIYGEKTLRDVEGVLSQVILSYRVFEVIVGIYFAVMCKLVLDSLMDSTWTNNLLIDFTHGIVCVLGLVVFLVGVKVEENGLFYHQAGFEFEIDPIKFIGLYFLVFSACSWVMMRKKWRVPSIIFILLGLIGISSGIFFIISMHNRLHKGASPKDIISTEDIKTVDMVSLVPEETIWSMMAVEKYSKVEKCPDVLKVQPWESQKGEVDNDVKCLNPESLGILTFFSMRMYVIFTSLVIYLILLNCFIIFETVKLFGEQDHIFSRQLPRCTIGILFGILFLTAIGISNTKSEEPRVDQQTLSELQVKNFIARNQELAATMFMRPIMEQRYYESISDPVTKYDLYTFAVFKSDKFMIIRLPANNLDSPFIYYRGEKGTSYQDFLDKMGTIQHGLGMIWVRVEHIDRLIIVRLIRPGTPQKIIEGYPSKVALQQEIGFIPVSSVEELKLESVLRKVKDIFRMKAWEQDKYGVDDLTSIFNMAEDIELPTENFVIAREGIPVISNQLFYQKIGDMLTRHTCKYVISNIKENNTIEVIDIGYRNKTYPYFLEALNSPRFRIGVIDFVYEEVHQPIAVIWEPKKLKPELNVYFVEILDWLINKSIPIMNPKGMIEMNLNFMVEYGAEDDPVKRKEQAKDVKETLLHL